MPQVIANSGTGRLEAAAPPAALRSFHRSLPDHQPTRLLSLDDLATELGVGSILLKDETERMGLPSFKIAGASWAVAAGVKRRLGLEDSPEALSVERLRVAAQGAGLTLCAATDGNHGRAVARMASLLGVACRVFVPDSLPEDRIVGILGEGADVVRVNADYDATVAEAARWSEATPGALHVQDTSWKGYEYLPAQVVQGYDTILSEVDGELSSRGLPAPDLVLAQMGVGSFGSAVISHYGTGGPRFVSVEPDSADCVAASIRNGELTEVPGPHTSIMAGLNCGVVNEQAWPVLKAGLDACVTISDDQARDGMRYLAEQGIAAGECSGGAVAGLRQLLVEPAWREKLELDPDSVILLFATEGVTEPSSYVDIVGADAARRLGIVG